MLIQVWSPANLLLVGEYVVTEEGGLGIAAAVQPELTVRVSPAPEFKAQAQAAQPLFSWRANEPPPPHAEVVAACLENAGYTGFPALHIEIDSSAFYTAGGNKRGLGSSAAVAAGLSTALFLFDRCHPGNQNENGSEAGELNRTREGNFAELPQETRRTILSAAVNAHRTAQRGGSAYDVTASLHGGLGLFRGGELPTWDSLPAEALPPAVIRFGDAPVSSPAAVLGYRGLKAAHPESVQQHLTRSNEEARLLASALRTFDQASFRATFQRLADRGLELGERIGVPAVIQPVPNGYGKAVGAGNELAVIFHDMVDHDTVNHDSGFSPGASSTAKEQPLRIATQGVRWCIRE